MGFRVFENLIDDIHQRHEQPTFEKLLLQPSSKAMTVIQQEARKQAVLVYCTTELKDAIVEQVANCTYIDATVS